MRIKLIAILEIDADLDAQKIDLKDVTPLALAGSPDAEPPTMAQLGAMLMHAAREDDTLLRTLTGPVAKAH